MRLRILEIWIQETKGGFGNTEYSLPLSGSLVREQDACPPALLLSATLRNITGWRSLLIHVENPMCVNQRFDWTRMNLNYTLTDTQFCSFKDKKCTPPRNALTLFFSLSKMDSKHGNTSKPARAWIEPSKCNKTKGGVPNSATEVAGRAPALCRDGWEVLRPRTGKSIPTVLSIAHHGTISLSVLENIITPRAPCNSPAPDKLPTWLSPGCKVGAPLAGCQGFKKALGAQGSLPVPVSIHWKPQFRGEKAPWLHPRHRASWHPGSADAGTLPPVSGAGFCCGWHGEGDYLHCGFWCKSSLSHCMNGSA